MSNVINNEVETHNKCRMLFVLFFSLFFLLIIGKDIFSEHLGTEIKPIVSVLHILFALLAGWFGIKMERISRIIKNDSKLLIQSKDERNIQIDYKSRGNGFIGMVAFIFVFLVIAEIMNGLYKNTFLYDINAKYIALMILAVGAMVTAVSMYFLDKE